MSMPVMVAPMAMHGLAHADKEVGEAHDRRCTKLQASVGATAANMWGPQLFALVYSQCATRGICSCRHYTT
jgi:hypothetical protein